MRAAGVPQGLYVAQDTGSGGSWPISTDRVVWFLAARHLLDDPAFADDTWHALRDTLAQDREYAFDRRMGLYRGETSFLDWREQTYPAWTAEDVRFIAESFALSTNVLHYDALQLAVQLATQRHDAQPPRRIARRRRTWRSASTPLLEYKARHVHELHRHGRASGAVRGLRPAGDFIGDRCRVPCRNSVRANRWRTIRRPRPEAPWSGRSIATSPIYHNRAIWPFVSAYALKAARRVGAPERIAHELRSLMRGAALAGSNMENYEFLTQAVHVDDGKLSGPVVNSPRQLWSVAAYLDMVLEGVFGLQENGDIDPQLPTELVPMLFGDCDAIHLQLSDRRITLRRPRALSGNLLVAGEIKRDGNETIVELRAETVADPRR